MRKKEQRKYTTNSLMLDENAGPSVIGKDNQERVLTQTVQLPYNFASEVECLQKYSIKVLWN